MAEADPRTVAKYLAGQRVVAMVAGRIHRALLDLKFIDAPAGSSR